MFVLNYFWNHPSNGTGFDITTEFHASEGEAYAALDKAAQRGIDSGIRAAVIDPDWIDACKETPWDAFVTACADNGIQIGFSLLPVPPSAATLGFSADDLDGIFACSSADRGDFPESDKTLIDALNKRMDFSSWTEDLGLMLEWMVVERTAPT